MLKLKSGLAANADEALMVINNIISDQLSLKLRALSFVAAFCVALLHFGQWIDEGSVMSAAIKDAIVRGFAFFSVSFFFAVSGFLLARNYAGTMQWWRNMLRKRYHSLLCPYLFWCTFGGVVSVVSSGVTEGWLQEFMHWYGIAITPQNVLPRFFSMWYVRNLMVLCVVSPLLFLGVDLIDRTRVGRLLSLIVILLAMLIDFPLKDQLVMSTLYFCLGIWFAKNYNLVLRQWNVAGITIALVVVLLLKCLARYWATSCIHQLHCIMVPIAIAFTWTIYDRLLRIGSFRLVLESCFAQRIVALSFPVYVLHTALLLYCPMPSGEVLRSCAYPFLMAMLSVAVAYVVMTILRYISPVAVKFIMGGRG